MMLTLRRYDSRTCQYFPPSVGLASAHSWLYDTVIYNDIITVDVIITMAIVPFVVEVCVQSSIVWYD